MGAVSASPEQEKQEKHNQQHQQQQQQQHRNRKPSFTHPTVDGRKRTTLIGVVGVAFASPGFFPKEVVDCPASASKTASTSDHQEYPMMFVKVGDHLGWIEEALGDLMRYADDRKDS